MASRPQPDDHLDHRLRSGSPGQGGIDNTRFDLDPRADLHPRGDTVAADTRVGANDQPETPVLGISATQVAGSALAAVSAAVSGSWLGVNGTLIGAAVASIVGTIGSAMYTYSLQRGSHVVRRGAVVPRLRGPRGLIEDGAAGEQQPPGQPPASQTPPVRRTPVSGLARGWRALPWGRITLGAATVLVVALGTLTVVEGLAGKPVSSFATGEDGGGTTLGRVVDTGPTEAPVETDPVIPTPTPDTPALPTPTEPEPTEPTEPAEPTPSEPESPEPTEPAEPTPSEPTEPTEPTPGAAGSVA